MNELIFLRMQQHDSSTRNGVRVHPRDFTFALPVDIHVGVLLSGRVRQPPDPRLAPLQVRVDRTARRPRADLARRRQHAAHRRQPV